LFTSEKNEEAREMIKNVMSDYLDEKSSDAEAKITLRNVTSKQIADMAKNATKNMLSSDQTDVLKEGLNLLKLALKYSPEDEEIAVIRTQIEDKLISTIIVEGKELEAKGDVRSLEIARDNYERAYKEYSESESLKQAITDVKITIGNVYYDYCYELEQVGDEESLKEALGIYESVLKYKELDQDERFEEAHERATVALAEVFYQRAFALEPEVGKSVQKGQEVISTYEDAQEWVENYKDTEQRIAAVKEAITVNVYVLAQPGDLFRTSEIELTSALNKEFNYFYYFTPATDGNLGFSPSMVENGTWMSEAKSKGLTYMVTLEGNAGSVQEDITEEQENLEINYKIALNGGIEEMSKSSLAIFNTGLSLYDGTEEEYLKRMDVKEYGTANITITEQTKKTYRDFCTGYKVFDVDTESVIYTKNLSARCALPSQTITSSVTSDNTQLRTWYLYKHHITVSTSFTNDQSEDAWDALYKKNTSYMTDKAATTIADAISKARN